jgi:hypothetical protein
MDRNVHILLGDFSYTAVDTDEGAIDIKEWTTRVTTDERAVRLDRVFCDSDESAESETTASFFIKSILFKSRSL